MNHNPPSRRLVAPETADIHVAAAVGDCSWWPRTDAPGNASCYAFQCADILEAWCETIGTARRIEPLFVTFFGTDGPALLLPLGLQQCNGVRVLRFLDAGLSDYNAPVVFPAAAGWSSEEVKSAWSALRPRLPPFDVAILEKMPELVEERRNPLIALTNKSHPLSCHYATLNGPWDEFARTHMRNPADSRRRRRKLEKRGAARFEIARTEERRERFLKVMMDYKRQKFFETKGYDAFTDPGYGEYYLTVTRRLGGGKALHISALLLDDQVLAAHWGYVFAGRFYQLMPAHATGEWREFAPGRLLNEWLMEWAFNEGLRYFDFGFGDEPYKFDHCDVHVPLRDAVIPLTAKGRIYAAMLGMTSAAKHALAETRVGDVLRAARARLRSGLHGGVARTPAA